MFKLTLLVCHPTHYFRFVKSSEHCYTFPAMDKKNWEKTKRILSYDENSLKYFLSITHD